MKGLFIPEISAEDFRDGCLESIEALMAEGEIYDIDYPLEECEDCISRHDAIHLADKLKDDLPDDERISDIVMAHNEGFLEYQTKLSLLPSVTPQQRAGRWIKASANRYDGKRECTRCGGWWIYGGYLPDYCPSCGAKMEDGG